MSNLLAETVEILELNGKTLEDILWYGNMEVRLPMSNLKSLFNIDYDNSYGSHEIPLDLIVVGKDFWLERDECDGSEWWEFKSVIKKPKKEIKLKRLETETLFPYMKDCIKENLIKGGE